jgi:hypothetical protein
VAFAGTLPTGGNAVTFPPCVRLTAVCLDVPPGQPGFIQAQHPAAGSSPAVADSNVYTIGEGGLYAFGPTPYQYDVDGDGEVTVDDLVSWEQSHGDLDVNLDGVVDATDRQALIDELARLGL